MLKMYHRHRHQADSPDLWDEAWGSTDFDEAERFCLVDPLRPVLSEYMKPGTLVLEGGCGAGQYVAHYSGCGAEVLGLDIAGETLRRLHSRDRSLMLAAADVRALPFSEGTFDVYFSGGVVEHFEGGPEQALREAGRILKPGGILLISVPYLSPLRRLTSLFKSGERKNVAVPEEDLSGNQEVRFWQYAYTRSEFEKILERADFKVISTRGYAILFGLYELPFVYKLVDRLRPRRVSQAGPARAASVDGRVSTPEISLLKRLVVAEDDSVILAGTAVRLLRRLSANMMMYVCVSRGRA